MGTCLSKKGDDMTAGDSAHGPVLLSSASTQKPLPIAEEGNRDLDLDDLFRSCYFVDFPLESSGLTNADSSKLDADERSASTISVTQPVGLDTEIYSMDRFKRNKQHARRSRLRQKFLLQSLKDEVHSLKQEIDYLKDVVRTVCPNKAEELITANPYTVGKTTSATAMGAKIDSVKNLTGPDYRLMLALFHSLQTFAVSDPNLPDNPIVYVSQGFLDLTGYTMNQVIGRNCRFLQGPETDQNSVEIIRKGIQEGMDTSVCLLNYKADGTPFWNQLFIAPLKDSEGNTVNYVGVQYEASKDEVEKQIAELKAQWKSGNRINSSML